MASEGTSRLTLARKQREDPDLYAAEDRLVNLKEPNLHVSVQRFNTVSSTNKDLQVSNSDVSSSALQLCDSGTQRHVNLSQRRSLTVRCAEVFRLFGPFGFMAFGGPAANTVMLRKIFVVREKWVDEETFTDLFALGNALPGPAFAQASPQAGVDLMYMLMPAFLHHQLSFSIALLRGGYLPALLSFILVTAPGALVMLGLGLGVRQIPSTLPDIVFALFSGLNAAAVGLIALAAYNLSSKVITDRLTRIEVLLSAAFAMCYESAWLYPVLMALGGLGTLMWDWWFMWRAGRTRHASRSHTPKSEVINMDLAPTRTAPVSPSMEAAGLGNNAVLNLRDDGRLSHRVTRSDTISRASVVSENNVSEAGIRCEEPSYFSLSVKGGLCLCGFFLMFLVIVLVVHATTIHQKSLDCFVNLLLAGTIIFGGGPVVVPLLRSYVVAPGWVNPRDFLLGFAMLQAVPGPLFNFAVFLGVLTIPDEPILGGLLGFVAIFLPGILIKTGVLPMYMKWRANMVTRSAIRGLNASAVGLVFAATYRLLRIGFISPSPLGSGVPALYASLDQDGWWIVITGTTFVACEWFDLPAPAAIVGGALGGIAWWGVMKS